MIKLIHRIFGHSLSEAKTPKGFSEFFTTTNSAEKKKVIRQVVRKANEDQKELIERYDREFSKVRV